MGIWLTSEERANLIRRAGTSAARGEDSSLAGSSLVPQQGLTVRGSSSFLLIHVTDRFSDPLVVDQDATKSTN